MNIIENEKIKAAEALEVFVINLTKKLTSRNTHEAGPTESLDQGRVTSATSHHLLDVVRNVRLVKLPDD